MKSDVPSPIRFGLKNIGKFLGRQVEAEDVGLYLGMPYASKFVDVFRPLTFL